MSIRIFVFFILSSIYLAIVVYIHLKPSYAIWKMSTFLHFSMKTAKKFTKSTSISLLDKILYVDVTNEGKTTLKATHLLYPDPTDGSTVTEPGTYTLQFEAGDGEFTVADTIQIELYVDACEHAKNQEDSYCCQGISIKTA